MSNNTTDESATIPVQYLFIGRINSAVILLENLIVIICLFWNKNKFYKREFWLLLVCLTLNDILCGFSMMLSTFIQCATFRTNLTNCAFVLVILMTSQFSMLYNVLSICIYRFVFTMCVDRFRIGWKTKMSVYQVLAVFTFCSIYCSLPFVIWHKGDLEISECNVFSLFGEYSRNVYAYFCCGLLLPLVLLNILYCVTFSVVRRNLATRNTLAVHTRCTRCSSVLTNRICHSLKHKTRDENEISEISDANSDTGIRRKCIAKNCQQSIENPLLTFKNSTHNLRDCPDEGKQGHSIIATLDENITYSKAQRRDALNKLLKPNIKDIHIKRRANKDIQRQCLILIGVILAGINITTWPVVIVGAIQAVIQAWVFPRPVTRVLTWLIFNNSLFNPWIYTAQSSEFRDAIKGMCKQIFRSRSQT